MCPEHTKHFLKSTSSIATSTHLCRGIQVGPSASSQSVTLTNCEKWGWKNRTKVIEGSASHSLCFLCDTTGLGRIFGEQLGQQGLICVAVAAKCSSHAEQAGNNMPTQVHCREESTSFVCFFILKNKFLCEFACVYIPLSWLSGVWHMSCSACITSMIVFMI